MSNPFRGLIVQKESANVRFDRHVTKIQIATTPRLLQDQGLASVNLHRPHACIHQPAPVGTDEKVKMVL